MTATTETIWNEFHDKLFHFINKRVKDADTAKDILQDVFIKIHLKLGTLTDQDKLTSWVYQVTRNSILDHFKKQKPGAALSENVAEIEDEETLNAELVNCMKPFISKLAPPYKEAILETELGQLSQKEYAEKIGISHSGAKSRVQRARQQLHELFSECCAVHADKYGNIMEKGDCKTNCGCE